MRSPTRRIGVALTALTALTLAAAPPDEVGGVTLPKKPRFILSDHKDVAWCVAFSPDGKSVVTSSGNRDASAGELRRYDLGGEKPVQIFLAEEKHGIRWLAFAPDGKTLATAEYDGMVRIRDAATGKVLAEFVAHPGGVQCLKFTRDGKALATCGKDGRRKSGASPRGRPARR